METAWIDVNYKEYSMDEISDEYLVHIIRFIGNGRGYEDFLTREKIIDLIKEASMRGLIKV